MKATNQVERFFKFAQKKIKLTAHAFRPDTIYGRVSGEKVVLTSIPKSGTNLIYQLLFQLPHYRLYTGRGLRPWMFSSESALAQKISKVRKGQILPGHIPALADVLNTVESGNIKVLFMIRDPRDVLLSHLKYVTHIDKTHPTHHFFKELENDDARMKALLFGVDGVVESIPAVYSNFMGWKTCKNAISIRFERLVGEQGGGDKNDQLKEIRKIVTHLNIDLSEVEIGDIAYQIFNTKSETFRSGKINQWKEAYSPSQIDLIKQELGTVLIDYGYENDENW